MIIRAGADDVAAVTALWNEVIRDTTITFTSAPKSEMDIAKLIETQPVFVAQHQSACVGFGTYGPFRSGDGYARTVEHAIYLSKGARGTGLGRAMLEALVQDARDTGAHSMIAGVSEENTQGEQFHAAMGFERVGLIPEVGYKFGRYLGLILMQKRL